MLCVPTVVEHKLRSAVAHRMQNTLLVHSSVNHVIQFVQLPAHLVVVLLSPVRHPDASWHIYRWTPFRIETRIVLDKLQILPWYPEQLRGLWPHSRAHQHDLGHAPPQYFLGVPGWAQWIEPYPAHGS